MTYTKTNLYSLGLEDRDRVNPTFGGGLPDSSIVLIEGEHGAGKSVITQRFCYGLAEAGSHVTYISTERTASGFIDQMRSLNYDVVDHLLHEQILFLHADVDTIERLDTSDDVVEEERELLTRLMEANVMWRSDVVIFDGFDSILLHDPRYEAIRKHGDEDDVIQNLITFFRRIVADGKSVVVTVNPSSLSDSALRPLRDVSDVYMSLEMKKVGQEVRRNVMIRKFAGMGNQVKDNIGFNVQSGRGLLIVNRTVA
ncbi:ATPase domain-containing protein [Halobacteriaceae archaeon GCM10025711]